MIRRLFLILIVAALSPASAGAGECWHCQLHGRCPLPSFDVFEKCTEDDGATKQVVPLPTAEHKWVDTPCGRIRSTEGNDQAQK